MVPDMQCYTHNIQRGEWVVLVLSASGHSIRLRVDKCTIHKKNATIEPDVHLTTPE